jgi:hypothetical protein
LRRFPLFSVISSNLFNALSTRGLTVSAILFMCVRVRACVLCEVVIDYCMYNMVSVFVCVPWCLEVWCVTILASACLLKFKMEFHILYKVTLLNWFTFHVCCQMTVTLKWWSEEGSYGYWLMWPDIC